MTSDTLKVVESEYDYDASPEAWEEYKEIYTTSRWGFWEKFDHDNLKKQGIRIYAPIKINEKYAQFNRYPKFKMSGDTDFNFGKDKKSQKKYEQFKELLLRDYKRDEFNVYLDELDQCYNRYHKLENFSFMPMTGGLQLVKGACQYDRLDMFVYRLSTYYETKGKDKFILSRARTCNREALETYLKLFDSIYDYCSKIYMINSKDFVDKITAQGEELIDSGVSVVRYMNLAQEFWDNKEQTLKNA
ncbi:hypothetical protein [Clostridium sp. UBA7503]|uniref:hypothetical protein n=1 Tax=Clostridium sp. UBA7503 TaxID=1946377 RepID=UPI0032168F07